MEQETLNGLDTQLEDIIRKFMPSHATRQLTPESLLVDELGIDSPRMIDIVLDVEDRFSITIEDSSIDKIQTLGDLIEMVRSKVRKAGGDV